MGLQKSLVQNSYKKERKKWFSKALFGTVDFRVLEGKVGRSCWSGVAGREVEVGLQILLKQTSAVGDESRRSMCREDEGAGLTCSVFQGPCFAKSLHASLHKMT